MSLLCLCSTDTGSGHRPSGEATSHAARTGVGGSPGQAGPWNEPTWPLPGASPSRGLADAPQQRGLVPLAQQRVDPRAHRPPGPALRVLAAHLRSLRPR